MPERSLKVLIVDDDPLMRRMIGLLVNNLGCEVIGEEADGDAALKTFKSRHPDLTFLDIDMPGRTALRCCNAFRP